MLGKALAVVALLAGCSPAGPKGEGERTAAAEPAVFTCRVLETACEPYTASSTSTDPVEPFPPSCAAFGDGMDDFELTICACEHERYVKELHGRAACIAERRAGAATVAYNEAVTAYNCRLDADGCRGTSLLGLFSAEHRNSAPAAPSCVRSFGTGHRLSSPEEAQACRADVEGYKEDLARWSDREAEETNADTERATRRAADSLECHAAGSTFCP